MTRSIKKDYRIDECRIFVNGFSGGGSTAIDLLMLYPEWFNGAISHARGTNLANRPAADNKVWPSHFPYLDQDNLRHVASLGKKWVLVSDPRDPNYEHIVASLPQNGPSRLMCLAKYEKMISEKANGFERKGPSVEWKNKCTTPRTSF